jgi:hypothetical protein
LSADLSLWTGTAVVRLAAAIDEAAALATGFFAGLGQTAAVVHAALGSSTTAALDLASTTVRQGAAGTGQLLASKRDTLQASVIVAFTVVAAAAAVDRIA